MNWNNCFEFVFKWRNVNMNCIVIFTSRNPTTPQPSDTHPYKSPPLGSLPVHFISRSFVRMFLSTSTSWLNNWLYRNRKTIFMCSGLLRFPNLLIDLHNHLVRSIIRHQPFDFVFRYSNKSDIQNLGKTANGCGKNDNSNSWCDLRIRP